MRRDDFERAPARVGRSGAGRHGSDALTAASTNLRRAFSPITEDDGFGELLRRIDGPGR